MKPELKAIWKTILDAPVGDPAGLHWRGNELWCGPIQFGGITGWNGRHQWYVCAGRKSKVLSLLEARQALLRAAQEQIRKGMEGS